MGGGRYGLGVWLGIRICIWVFIVSGSLIWGFVEEEGVCMCCWDVEGDV